MRDLRSYINVQGRDRRIILFQTKANLNTEGAGIQPMFANVNINFKFLGGQDIGGVVERLQNAISSNYYANASVYDSVAGKVAKNNQNTDKGDRENYFKK